MAAPDSGPVILTDDDVRAFPGARFVAAMRRALIDAHAGRLAAPPRVSAPVHGAEWVFTVGGSATEAGFRVYATGPDPVQQATLLWSEGCLSAVVVGDELGARRTGALGGVAVDLLASPDATVVGVVGSGTQAWTQLWATAAVRLLSDVRVFSPSPDHRSSFASRAVRELGIDARPSETAEAAVRDADVVILATRSTQPVIDAAWVRQGCHVTTVGPKTRDGHECPVAIPETAAVAATDAPDQVRAYPSGCFTDRQLVPLGAIATGETPGRTSPDDITFYLSTGLAGSEVVAAAALVHDRR
jgi:ornithine cyclodeaminase